MMSNPERSPHPVQRLREEVDRLLTGVLGDRPCPPSLAQPKASLWENDDSLFVELEVPGVKEEDVELCVVSNELSLKVTCRPVVKEGVTYHRQERPEGTLTRALRLPVEVRVENVHAELRDGVLFVQLPKVSGAQPRKIQVTASTSNRTKRRKDNPSM